MAILAPSLFLCPNLIILAYPPFLSLYLGPITSTSFLTISFENFRANNLREFKFPVLDKVICFSANPKTSFAFASVVLIFSFKIRALANARKSAFLWSFFRLSLRPFFLFLISKPSKTTSTRFATFAPPSKHYAILVRNSRIEISTIYFYFIIVHRGRGSRSCSTG